MKPFVLDREEAVRDLTDVQSQIRQMKDATRSFHGPGRMAVYQRNGHRKVRFIPGELVRQGRNFSGDEGRRYHDLQGKATMLCTALALTRGRIHKSPFLSHPDGLLDIVATMRLYEKRPEEIIAPAVVEEAQAEQTVNVYAGGPQ